MDTNSTGAITISYKVTTAAVPISTPGVHQPSRIKRSGRGSRSKRQIERSAKQVAVPLPSDILNESSVPTRNTSTNSMPDCTIDDINADEPSLPSPPPQASTFSLVPEVPFQMMHTNFKQVPNLDSSLSEL